MKRRHRWWHAALPALAGIVLAAGCDWWRSWDAPFYRDSWTLVPTLGWRGADGIVSVPLPNDSNGNRRTLWLFGDSWVYKTWGSFKINQVGGGEDFTQLRGVRNSIAVQAIPTGQPVWTPPAPAQLTFYATDSTPVMGTPQKTIRNLAAIGADATPKSFAY